MEEKFKSELKLINVIIDEIWRKSYHSKYYGIITPSPKKVINYNMVPKSLNYTKILIDLGNIKLNMSGVVNVTHWIFFKKNN